MAPKWEKDFNAQFTKTKNGVIVEKSTGLQITNKDYIKRHKEARNNYQTNKGFWGSPQNRNKGVNEKHWWKSPWIINQMLNSDVIDPDNPNKYLSIHQLKKLERKQRREELEIGIAQAKMETWNKRSYLKGGVNEKHFIGKDGHIFIYDDNGKRHKTHPDDVLGHYKKAIAARNKGETYIIPVSEGKVRNKNDKLPPPESERSDETTIKTNRFGESSPFNKPNTSLNISSNPPAPKLDREGGVPSERSLPKIRRNEVITPKNQVGKLRINPGGLVGRYDDVRRSDGRSTSLSIAQEDFMGIKKGENLGVLTRSQRDLYDKEVLKIGG